MKMELAQKEELISRLTQKVDHWKNILQDSEQKQTILQAGNSSLTQTRPVQQQPTQVNR